MDDVAEMGMASRNVEDDLRDFSNASLLAELRVEAIWRASAAAGGLVANQVLEVGSRLDESTEVVAAGSVRGPRLHCV